MAALRAFVLLLAVSAVCAGKISGSVRATGVQRAVHDATRHIESQIAEIENYGVVTDVIEEGLEKLKELVEKIRERVGKAEEALVKAVKKAAETVADKLNDFIKDKTGLDLHLDDKLEDFEDKTEKCTDELKSKVRATLLAIKTDAETCAAPQIEEAKKLVLQIRELIELLETVPVQTIKKIKQCVNPEPITTPAPPTEAPTTTEAPETTTDSEPEPEPEPTTEAPETTTDSEPEPEPTTEAEPEPNTDAPEPTTDSEPEPEPNTEAPETTTDSEPEPEPTTAQSDASEPDVDTNVVVIDFNKRKTPVRGISDIFEKVKCVVEVLGSAASELQTAPKLVYYLDKEIRNLASKETQKTLRKCAVKAVAGRGKELQKDAAELAYCIIAPSDD